MFVLMLMAGQAVPAMMAPAPAPASSLGRGYLAPDDQPDSTLLVPPPPASGSRAQAADERAARAAIRMQGSARWNQAIRDADLSTPAATGAFSCAAGIDIGPETTPALNRLMRKAAPDFAMAVYGAKRKYQRPRPFLANGAPVCTPEMRGVLEKDYSYPSGHAAIGEGWGMLLADLVPARAPALQARAAAFADSRRICNVHWRSDVVTARIVAKAVWVRLKATPGFQADLALARAEISTATVKPDAGACRQEGEALRRR